MGVGEDRSEGRGRAEAEPGALGSTKDAPRARAGFQTKPSLVSLVPLINSFITCTRGTGGGNPSPAPPGDASRSDSTPFFPFPSLHQDVPSLETLEHELAWMKETLSQLGSPVVLCHNDLLCKNIIYNRTQGWCAAARRAQLGEGGGLSPVSPPSPPRAPLGSVPSPSQPLALPSQSKFGSSTTSTPATTTRPSTSGTTSTSLRVSRAPLRGSRDPPVGGGGSLRAPHPWGAEEAVASLGKWAGIHPQSCTFVQEN